MQTVGCSNWFLYADSQYGVLIGSCMHDRRYAPIVSTYSDPSVESMYGSCSCMHDVRIAWLFMFLHACICMTVGLGPHCENSVYLRIEAVLVWKTVG